MGVIEDAPENKTVGKFVEGWKLEREWATKSAFFFWGNRMKGKGQMVEVVKK